jgi:hypothetical protein
VDGLGTGNGKIGQTYRLAGEFARPRDAGDPRPKVALNWVRTA